MNCQLIFLKLAANVIDKAVTGIINNSRPISEAIFPEAWKIASVVSVHKAGSFTEVDNFRRISLLPVLSKVLERPVHKALYSYLTFYKLLSYSQFGLSSRHSCATSLAHLVME